MSRFNGCTFANSTSRLFVNLFCGRMEDGARSTFVPNEVKSAMPVSCRFGPFWALRPEMIGIKAHACRCNDPWSEDHNIGRCKLKWTQKEKFPTSWNSDSNRTLARLKPLTVLPLPIMAGIAFFRYQMIYAWILAGLARFTNSFIGRSPAFFGMSLKQQEDHPVRSQEVVDQQPQL